MVPEPPIQPGITGQVADIIWSHFKPEFAGKLDEDVGAHLLQTIDWIDTHAFQEVVKVQRFYRRRFLILFKSIYKRKYCFKVHITEKI